MKCTCIKDIEAKLESENPDKSNFQIATGLGITNNTLVAVICIPLTFDITTKSGKVQHKKSTVIPTFCPFCGVNIKESYKQMEVEGAGV
jgi:hypothetical protein